MQLITYTFSPICSFPFFQYETNTRRMNPSTSPLRLGGASFSNVIVVGGVDIRCRLALDRRFSYLGVICIRDESTIWQHLHGTGVLHYAPLYSNLALIFNTQLNTHTA